MNTWFTSDTHYHHKNIVRGVTSWEGEGTLACRNFDTLEEHDQRLVDNINAVVKENDILYHLGDFSFGGIEQIYNFRKQINCKTIHLILGNHDHHIENNRTLPNAPKRLAAVFMDGSSSYVPIKAQDLFTSIHHVLNKKINGQEMFLSHYSHRTWPKMHKGMIHLFGHSHGSLDWQEWGKSMDIGIDTSVGFRPFHFEEIMITMNNRNILKIDHHTKDTN